MKRVIVRIHAYLSVLWVGLKFASRCNKARGHVSGSPLSWPHIRFFNYPLGLLAFIASYGASAVTQLLLVSLLLLSSASHAELSLGGAGGEARCSEWSSYSGCRW
jgi:hypothetical protein